jgi:hypothetical protein
MRSGGDAPRMRDSSAYWPAPASQQPSHACLFAMNEEEFRGKRASPGEQGFLRRLHNRCGCPPPGHFPLPMAPLRDVTGQQLVTDLVRVCADAAVPVSH